MRFVTRCARQSSTMPFDVRDLGRFQADFLDRITSPKASGVLRVFHDTWFHGLLDGLRDVYPATMQALGEPAFNAFARDYIRSHPLTSGDQTLYGKDFPAFLEAHPQAGPLAWLSDLARLEWAEHSAHHAADAAPCGFDDLLDPEARVGLHPSVQPVRLSHNADAWRGGEATFVLQRIDSQWLIVRDRDDHVVRLRLTPGDAAVVDHLVATGSLTAVLGHCSPDALAHLQTLIARLVQAGFLITTDGSPS